MQKIANEPMPISAILLPLQRDHFHRQGGDSVRSAALVILTCVFAQSRLPASDVPLTIREVNGVARIGNPVNSGVPFAKGEVREIRELQLVDTDGKAVPASIEPRSRWLGDESLKWVTVHFVADIDAKGTRRYRLTNSRVAASPSALHIERAGETITVVTGRAKFVIPTDRLAPLSQVYLRSHLSRDFVESDAMLARPATVVLQCRNGESRVVPRVESKNEFKSELVRLGEPFMPNSSIQSAVIEEQGPGRAVIALKGTFSTAQTKSLDFTARLYFYGGSPLVQMTFSIVNRQMDSMARFVGIERLAVLVPLKIAGPPRVLLSKDGQTLEAKSGPKPIRLIQSAFNKMRITNGESVTTDGARSEGWVQAGSAAGALTAGTRWFWQVYPIGIEVGQDGTVGLELKPADTERVDLYTAGAKTHFLFFHFSRQGAVSPEAVAAGTTHPLVAASSPDRYCQETRVMGDLFSSNPNLYEPKYRDLVSRYQAHVDSCLTRLVSDRPRPGWDVDEYGWLNFGSGLHHRNYVRENASESWWDSNYYDFPHAALINYLRTGDQLNLTTAEEAGLHLADLDICHSFPGYPDRAGSPRSGPVVGHFRNYARGQEYMGHDSFTFYKNESLYELYYLTGERWYQEVGLMSSDFALAFWGKGALRNLAHGIWGVLSAYNDTHQQKYLDRARFFMDGWGKPWQDANGGGFNDQEWMYGLAFEAYDKYYRLTADKSTASYLVKALDAMIKEFWKPEGGTGGLYGINLFGYGLGYEYTGSEEYFRKGLVLLERASEPEAEGDRVKTFAQSFRSSPYFMKYLTAGYKPKPVLEQK